MIKSKHYTRKFSQPTHRHNFISLYNSNAHGSFYINRFMASSLKGAWKRGLLHFGVQHKFKLSLRIYKEGE